MSAASANPNFRFGGVARLYGPAGLQRLAEARVLAVGLGGVGSWAVEALARSAVGRIDLVDLDDVCESNVNRQIHALDGAIGKPKADAMAERCRLINPEGEFRPARAFATAKNVDELLDEAPDFVLDAIDSVAHKSALVDACRRRAVPLIVCGAAGGRIDPSLVRTADLSRSGQDGLLRRLRKELRARYGYPRDPREPFGVECVFSTERARRPQVCEADGEPTSLKLDCAGGYGAAAHLTGAFAFLAVSRIVGRLAQADAPEPAPPLSLDRSPA